MWQQNYERLNNAEKELFKKLVNLILAKSFFIRDYFDEKESRMRIHGDYKFMERHWELFTGYLSFGGWTLHKDNTYGVIHLISQYEYNRFQFNKFTTMILLTLRLIFEEKREEVSLRNEVVIQNHELVQKMTVLGVVEKKPAFKDLTEALKTLAGFNILGKLSGKWDSPEATLMILPSILFILANERISQLNELLVTGAEEETIGEENPEEEDEL